MVREPRKIKNPKKCPAFTQPTSCIFLSYKNQVSREKYPQLFHFCIFHLLFYPLHSCTPSCQSKDVFHCFSPHFYSVWYFIIPFFLNSSCGLQSTPLSAVGASRTQYSTLQYLHYIFPLNYFFHLYVNSYHLQMSNLVTEITKIHDSPHLT